MTKPNAKIGYNDIETDELTRNDQAKQNLLRFMEKTIASISLHFNKTETALTGNPSREQITLYQKLGAWRLWYETFDEWDTTTLDLSQFMFEVKKANAHMCEPTSYDTRYHSPIEIAQQIAIQKKVQQVITETETWAMTNGYAYEQQHVTKNILKDFTRSIDTATKAIQQDVHRKKQMQKRKEQNRAKKKAKRKQKRKK